MSKLNVAICQAAPIPLCIDDGITQAVELARAAIKDGAEIVAFGETFLGGYPLWLDESPGAALWDHPGTKAMHAILMDQAVMANDFRFAPLQDLVDETGALVSIGAHERIRSSLFNNQMLFRPNAAPLDHRKLVPTHGERLVWMRGDGSTLGVHEAEWGNVGSLICWEHWMPFARAAMHNQEEAVHVAAWPTVRETYAIASRHYAFEGRCFVLAAGLVQTREQLRDGVERCEGNDDALALLDAIEEDVLNRGGSMIIGPDGRILAHAGEGEETIHAEIDLEEVAAAKALLDTDGHYSRPDIFSLDINTDPQQSVRWK
ncbi:carbon-nitrogen hydrolase family protein [Sphingomicrobium sediminis]|uniref:Carbon-nitrogen hydrolase family protein n=1 Tax=Sphingomicrobium sediminis TaxID=2950949 RepID=A0A9X2EF94_9SPHN|nr:carbon-nitrogen hydrolase family protein [Sphingomicrobium sediminis]MCM8556903.1 carbon-nitrogen hydrolase family protein [Sphingomicrobium sediminis]